MASGVNRIVSLFASWQQPATPQLSADTPDVIADVLRSGPRLREGLGACLGHARHIMVHASRSAPRPSRPRVRARRTSLLGQVCQALATAVTRLQRARQHFRPQCSRA
jgi:hypothetical protein